MTEFSVRKMVAASNRAHYGVKTIEVIWIESSDIPD